MVPKDGVGIEPLRVDYSPCELLESSIGGITRSQAIISPIRARPDPPEFRRKSGSVRSQNAAGWRAWYPRPAAHYSSVFRLHRDRIYLNCFRFLAARIGYAGAGCGADGTGAEGTECL
jgi:hypothetical protein